jgi:hypothetical protein
LLSVRKILPVASWAVGNGGAVILRRYNHFSSAIGALWAAGRPDKSFSEGNCLSTAMLCIQPNAQRLFGRIERLFRWPAIFLRAKIRIC